MNSFSIAELSQFSGIKQHTIRMWEQRYDALQPNRTEGNTRLYDDAQLRRLLNIVSLSEAGHKVSEMCLLSDKELFSILQQEANQQTTYFIHQLISAGIEYDEIHFEKVFSHCLLRYGMKETYTQILYPMLVRMGLMWVSNLLFPPHEHFITNLIRQKLFTAIDSLPVAKQTTGTWLLFLPENEFHEIGLLLACYLIRLAGRKVIYLGANMPLQTINDAVRDTSVKHLLFFLVHKNNAENLRGYLKNVTGKFPRQKIYVAANSTVIKELESVKKINWLPSLQELENNLL